MAAPRPQTLYELRVAISTVVDYIWEPEMADYRENRRDMDNPEAHVFHMLVALNNWVHGVDQDPDQLVEYQEDDDDG